MRYDHHDTMAGRYARNGRHIYTISRLLLRQPKTLRKYENYAAALAHFNTSERLRRLRISRRCYSLLDRATVSPENLRHFYRTYHLPQDPFFPLFFAAKRRYLADRERIKEERRLYILDSMRALPAPIRADISYLGNLERHYNASGRYPVWQESLFPSSKKRSDELSRYTNAAWLLLFRRHLALLMRRYRGLPGAVADRVHACFVLELTPERIPPRQPPPSTVNGTFRRLSLLHHPDHGGDAAMFVEIKRARDLLIRRR